MINYSEAQDEARRLTKVSGREVEVTAIDCNCDYSKRCYLCAGSGTHYELVYALCSHLVKDDDRDEEYQKLGCLERELDAEREKEISFQHPVLQSLSEAQSERDEAA
jgi:hypothetical protein